jgi:hypothetical protein
MTIPVLMAGGYANGRSGGSQPKRGPAGILASAAFRAEILRQDDETPEIIVGAETLRLASIGYAVHWRSFTPPPT